MHRLPEFCYEQVFAMKMMILAGMSSALAAMQTPLALMFDPFSAEPLTGNSAFLALVAGSLGGAFISTQRGSGRSASTRDTSQWSRRMALSTVCGVFFTPIALHIAGQLDMTFFGIQVKIVPNAAVVLAGSAIMALFWKEVIRYVQDKFTPKKDE